jgi:ribosomal protein S18 acetylase RimI-like enzyme
MDDSFHIRRAVVDDADGIADVLERITAERIHSAIDKAWTAEQQSSYLVSLTQREAFHVATAKAGDIIGYQSLDLYSRALTSMAHVGQLGTFILPAWRGRGVGTALFQATHRFARAVAYRTFLIQVRASNGSAQRFYRKLGFLECGRLTAQVTIDDREDDEILMEYFVQAG